MRTRTLYKLVLFVVLSIPSIAAAQTTEFTQQGTLPDPFANGVYDFEFRLFDVPTGGTPL